MMWPLIVVLAVGLVLTVVFFAGRELFPGTRAASRAFRCPFRDHDVEAEFAEGVWDGRYQDVTRCSEFTPPTAVSCAKGCLHDAVTTR